MQGREGKQCGTLGRYRGGRVVAVCYLFWKTEGAASDVLESMFEMQRLRFI